MLLRGRRRIRPKSTHKHVTLITILKSQHISATVNMFKVSLQKITLVCFQSICNCSKAQGQRLVAGSVHHNGRRAEVGSSFLIHLNALLQFRFFLILFFVGWRRAFAGVDVAIARVVMVTATITTTFATWITEAMSIRRRRGEQKDFMPLMTSCQTSLFSESAPSFLWEGMGLKTL